MSNGEKTQLGWIWFAALGVGRRPSNYTRLLLILAGMIVFILGCLALAGIAALIQG